MEDFFDDDSFDRLITQAGFLNEPEKTYTELTPVKITTQAIEETQVLDAHQVLATLYAPEEHEKLLPAGLHSDPGTSAEGSPTVGSESTLRHRSKRKNLENWTQNLRKKQRNSGIEYSTKAGKVVAKKSLGEPCQCKNKCIELVPQEERRKIFNEFWGLANYDRQNDMLAHLVRQENVKKRLTNSSFRKMFTTIFTLASKKVCKIFFLSTFDISEKRVRVVLQKAADNVLPRSDQRGKTLAKNKLPTSVTYFADEHIDSFPRVPGHWCRANTKKEYLEATLTKEMMYSLYLDLCKEKKVQPVSKTTYMEMLIKKNIGFHTPKKDSCWCVFFNELPVQEQEEKKELFETHIQMKNLAKEEKNQNALRAKDDPSYFSGNFDLQAVLYAPLFHGKPLFYKRKLATFNLTFFDVGKKKGYSFVWPETEGKRGGNEIASCLFKFLEILAGQGYSHVSFFSDSCPGQNKNRIVCSAVLAYLQTTTGQKPAVINLKFHEPGHTNMQCDSMHACIEKASKRAKICTPADWPNVIALAKKTKPYYEVQKLGFTDFFDFKAIDRRYFPNMKVTTEGKNVPWKKIKWLQFRQDEPYKIFFKLRMDGEFEEIISTKQQRSAGNKIQENPSGKIVLIPAYYSKQPITLAKYNDLQALCKSNVIPKEYHRYYKELQFEEGPEDEDDLHLIVMRERLKKRV